MNHDSLHQPATGPRLSSDEAADLVARLKHLSAAGLPLGEGLRAAAEELSARPARALRDLAQAVDAGQSLDAALLALGDRVPAPLGILLSAGLRSNQLAQVLEGYVEHQRRLALARQGWMAVAYPALLIAMVVCLALFFAYFVATGVAHVFEDFGTELPAITQVLITISTIMATYWYLIPVVPICVWLFVKLMRKFKMGRMGWDLFVLKIPVFGMIIEKNTVARTTRTLGTLVASGVPILEALNITKETSGNALFETMYGKIWESIREGETIARPMREYSRPPFNPFAVLFWFMFVGGPVGVLLYLMKMRQRIVDDLVVNMVDVGEETGELDTMLYKVADTYDEEVSVLTESLVSLLEPLMVVLLGGMVGFIVVALFMPLIKIIETLT